MCQAPILQAEGPFICAGLKSHSGPTVELAASSSTGLTRKPSDVVIAIKARDKLLNRPDCSAAL